MTAPSTPLLSLASDKQVYSVGDPITVTATYSDSQAVMSEVTLTISAVATDAQHNSADATLAVQVETPTGETAPQSMDVIITDSFGDLYSQQSNDGISTAVFTGTIGSPPAA